MNTFEKILAGFSLNSGNNFSLMFPAESILKITGNFKMKSNGNQKTKIPIVTQDIHGATKKQRNIQRCLFLLLILLSIAIAAAITVNLLLASSGESPHISYKNRTTTAPKNSFTAIETGSAQLLNARKDWQWAPYTNAEAILGLTLADNQRFNKNNGNFYLSVQAMNLELLAALDKDVNLTNERWSRGKLAQYISALQMTDQDPRDFYGHNLLTILKQHMKNSLEYFRQNRFAFSWIAIALCNNNEMVDNSSLSLLTANPGHYKFGVDEASMILMALTCLNDVTAKQAAGNYIAEELRLNYSSYNEYSKSLAVQALIASEKQGVNNIIAAMVNELEIAVLKPGSKLLQYPGAASHILPALAGKSYLNVGDAVSSSRAPTMTTTTTTVMPTAMINVTITVENGTVNASWNVLAANGSTLFQCMQKLQQQADDFSFISRTESWGESIKAINGVTADTAKFLYWQLLKGDVSSQTGVSSTYPKDGDHFIFRLTSWKTR